MTTAPHLPTFKGHRALHRCTQTINAPPDRVFALICPVREAEWLHGWVGRPLYALSGLAEENGVYATDHADQDDPTVWLITRRDPATYETEFVYFVPGVQVVRLSVVIKPLGTRQSSVFIRYVRTGISQAGNDAIAQARQTGAYDRMTSEWETAMNHYLGTGQRLTAVAVP